MATTKVTPAPLTRPLYEIAREICKDYWDRDKPVYFAAEPYVMAMGRMKDMDDTYFDDDADTVVLYALSNLSTWRGKTAKRVKAELQAARAHHAIARHLPRDR